MGYLISPRWIRMPKTQTRTRSKEKRNQQLDKTFITHYKSLGLKTAEDYIQWCAKNGFSRRIKKTARERALEKAKHARTANPLTRTNLSFRCSQNSSSCRNDSFRIRLETFVPCNISVTVRPSGLRSLGRSSRSNLVLEKIRSRSSLRLIPE